MILQVRRFLELRGRQTWELEGGGYFVEGGGYASTMAEAFVLADLLVAGAGGLTELISPSFAARPAGRPRLRVLAGGRAASAGPGISATNRAPARRGDRRDLDR